MDSFALWLPQNAARRKKAPEQKRKPLQGDTVSTRRRFDFEAFGHEALKCLFLWCPRLPPECLFKCVRVLAAPERCPPQKGHPSKSAKPSKQTRFRHVNALTLRFLATRLWNVCFCGARACPQSVFSDSFALWLPQNAARRKKAPEQKRKPFQADAVSTRRRFDFEVFGHEALKCLFLWRPRLPPGSRFKCLRALAAPERCTPQKGPPSKSANLSKQTRFRPVAALTLKFLATRL